jgi:hypothetical protein
MLGQQANPVAADFSNNGKIDLVVAQNSAATQLFKNTSARAGLRVTLRGPAGNLDAIGAQLRGKAGDRLGPVREIQCSSGSTGQSSFTQIFAATGPIAAIHVLWPGGKTADYPITGDMKNVVIDFEKGVVIGK